MSDINITVNDEIVNIDVIDEPVLVEVTNSPGPAGPAGVGVPVGGTTGQVLAKSSATNYDTAWVNASGGTWGTITGTLSNQTDLQNALNAKLDESTIDGGTEGQILSKASGTDFDFTWINNYAKYLATNVRNQTGSTIGAFQVVYISGATGNKPLVSLADADTEATSSKTYGVTATSIANNGTGDVVTAGELSGINTSAFNEGDLLWLSTTAGGVVTSPPAEPAHAVFIGYVVRSHPSLGVIDVAIANGYELNELHGVQITSALNNDGLFYNSGNGLWENKSINTALGFTPANAATTLTINGVTYDLSTSRTWTISTGISGSGAAGQVTYWTGASAVGGSNNLFWDNANGRLGIGTNAPAYKLEVSTTSGSQTSGILIKNTGAGTSDYASLNLLNNNNILAQVFNTSSTYTIAPVIGSNGFGHYTNGVGGLTLWADGGIIKFVTGTGAGAAGTQKMTLFGNGNLGIGTGSTDLGTRLGVIGDTLLRGSGNTNSTLVLTAQNSDSANVLRVFNGGSIGIGNSSDRPLIFPFTTSAGSPNLTGTNLSFVSGTGTQAATQGIFAFENTAAAQTSGNNYFIRGLGNYAPTSGTGTYAYLRLEGTINQTGGANGVTRGLWIAPTLTAAADFRAIETTAGNVLFGSNFFWDNTNGRLGIGTNAPASRLSVTNTVAGEFIQTLRASGTPNPAFNIEDGDISIPNYSSFGFNPSLTNNTVAVIGSLGASIGGMQFASFSANTDERAMFLSAFSGRTTATTNPVMLLRVAKHDGATNATTLSANDIAFQYNNWTSPLVRIMGSGNFIINNTTDSTAHKFQVYGDTLLRGSGATSATTALTVQNSSSTNLFTVRNDGNVGIGTNAPSGRLHVLCTNFSDVGIFERTPIFTNALAASSILRAGYAASPSTGAGPSFAFQLRVNAVVNDIASFGAARDGSDTSGYLSFATFNAGTQTEKMQIKASGNAIIQNGGTFTDIASALLQVSSTTQGFLPPRMTTTQKNAIATPAAGLVVYDTTLNKLCVYTTAWETITSV